MSNWGLNFRYSQPLTLPGGRVKVVDLWPKNAHPIPLVIEPGWVGHPDVFRRLAILLAEAGRRVILVYAPHGVKTARVLPGVSHAEMRKAEALLQILDAMQIPQADVLGHSEAGIFVPAAATLEPDRFHTLVFFAPAGLIGRDNFFALAFRFFTDVVVQAKASKKSRDPEWKATEGVGLKWALKSMAINPVRSFQEVLAIAKNKTWESMGMLRRNGIDIVVLVPPDDRVFPVKRMRSHVTSQLLDCFRVVGGEWTSNPKVSTTHNACILSPREYMPLIIEALHSDARSQQVA